MTDASLIDQLASAMIAPAVDASPDLIGKAVREQTVATVKDLKRPCDQDLEAALQIVPLIAVGAARGATDIGAPFGTVMGAVMRGAIGGTIEIGGDPVRATREAAEALIEEAGRQDADVDRTVVGVVRGAAETEGHRETARTEAAVVGLMNGAAQISSEAEEAVEQALRHADELPHDPITRVLAGRVKAPR